MGSARRRWSYSAGEWGRNRVRAYEDSGSGLILVEFYERLPGQTSPRRKRVSLHHRDRDKAKMQADRIAAELSARGRHRLQEVTLGELFELYLSEVTPQKSAGKQAHDRRCARMMSDFFGERRRPSTLNRRDWDRFIHERHRGALAPGKACGEGVGNRQVAYDLRFLSAVLNWATLAGDASGSPLLERNPLKGMPFPREMSPARPVMTSERYQKMLAVGEDVDWRFWVALVLAHETGHRIGAIRSLRWSDFNRDGQTLTWRAENDKLGLEHEVPLTDEAASALAAARVWSQGIGEAYVLPSPGNRLRPCSRHLLRNWWYRAEELAGLEHVPRMGWHSLRRKFATELKHVPLKDLCHLGGWKSPQTVLKCYQQADGATMRAALAQRAELDQAADG